MHDSNIRKNIYHITNNLLSLMHKTANGNNEIINYIANQRSQLEIILALLREIPNFDVNSEQTQMVLDALQVNIKFDSRLLKRKSAMVLLSFLIINYSHLYLSFKN